MNARILLGLGVSALALPAAADINPSDVWTLHQKQYAESGLDIETRDVETLASRVTVRGLVLGSSIEDEFGGTFTFSIDVGDVTYRANGDGTVTIEWPASFPMSLVGDGPDGTGSGTLSFELPGLNAVASGDPGDMTTTWNIPSMIVTTGDVVMDGEPVDMSLNMVAGASTGTNRLVDGDFLRQVTDFVTESLSVTMNVTAPPSEPTDGSLNLVYDVENLAIQSDGVIFDNTSELPFGQLLSEGVTGSGSFTYSSSNTVVNAFEEGAPVVAYVGSDQGGRFDISFDASGLDYSASSSNGAVSVAGAEIPLPQVDFAYGEAAFRFAMPLIPADEAQDFALRIRLGDLTVSDLIWSLIDPTQQIPRDPATLEIDLSGSGQLAVDLTDPESMGPGQIPGQVDTLAINAIELALAGARLTGSGAFDMDNSGNGPFAPAPTPVGSVDMMLVGGNALLDQLIEMGLLPQDQAMGFRMMLGLFARPGVGEDSLVSTIEVTAEGAVLANGQRIR